MRQRLTILAEEGDEGLSEGVRENELGANNEDLQGSVSASEAKSRMRLQCEGDH
jgi:hypothetical protein